MTLIIENEIELAYNVDVCNEFVYICNSISAIKSEGTLREVFGNIKLTHFFCGFGGHHMWVHQKSYDNIRIIFVPFEKKVVIF